MNETRRKALIEISQQLQELNSHLEQLQEDEQEDFDKLTEDLQKGESGQAMDRAIKQLDIATDLLVDALDSIDVALV